MTIGTSLCQLTLARWIGNAQRYISPQVVSNSSRAKFDPFGGNVCLINKAVYRPCSLARCFLKVVNADVIGCMYYFSV